MGCTFALKHMHQNIFQYIFGAQQCIVVPISQDGETDAVQIVRSSDVVLRVIDMLPTVDLHYHSLLDTYKVNNISAEWILAAELVSAQPPITKIPP